MADISPSYRFLPLISLPSFPRCVDDFQEVPESEKTPVTVVTGFLGAGKSTLVNYVSYDEKACESSNGLVDVSCLFLF
jgi:predicted ATPase